jgi:hypothetical protein
MLILLLAYDVLMYSTRFNPQNQVDVADVVDLLSELPYEDLCEKYRENHKVDFNIEYEVMCN